MRRQTGGQHYSDEYFLRVSRGVVVSLALQCLTASLSLTIEGAGSTLPEDQHNLCRSLRCLPTPVLKIQQQVIFTSGPSTAGPNASSGTFSPCSVFQQRLAASITTITTPAMKITISVESR